MRIIAWNCNMAFRKKAELVLQLEPDILVVPECECPDKLKFPSHVKLPTSIAWHGDNPNKGLGVFTYGDYKLQVLPVHNPALKTIIPLSVTGNSIDLTLFAIWANNPADKPDRYIGQVWKAIHFYDELIHTKRTILAGDFNSNTIWDKAKRIGNHSTVVKVLEAKQISSAYHHHFGCPHGKEEHPTFNLYKNPEKPYHIDYCFASGDLMDKLQYIEIGNHEKWHVYSDHMPLIADFDVTIV
jgi:exonuclease III